MDDDVFLNIRINAETAEALRKLMARDNASATVEVWRAISLLVYMDNWIREGGRIQWVAVDGSRMDVTLPMIVK